MAEETTPKTTQATDNSKPISAMPELTTAQGSTLVPVVDGGNKKVKLSTIKSYVNEGMVAQQAGKGLSTNDFTNALKAKLDSLSNYDDAQLRQAVNALKGEIDTILGDGATSAIDTFNEIEAFLTGITDTQTLTGLLQQLKSTITGETDGKLANKVDKVSGKALSTNDYTNAEKAAVATIGNKVDKVDGKGLSANDYTNDDKAKLGALPTKSGLDASLAAKLDKSVWDEEHEQFTIKGYFLGKRGNINAAGSEISGATPLLPLNKTYSIVLKNVLARGNAVAVCFYGADGSFISYPEGIEDLNGDFTITVDKYPAGACYFRACSEKAGSAYSNDPTQESREGAISEAIQASKLALFIDQWNAACGSWGKYDPANAPDAQHPFYLNTLWLTYNEAIAIMLQLKTWGTSKEDFIWVSCATNIPKFGSSRQYVNSFIELKVVNFSSIYPNSFIVCLNSGTLTKILNLEAAYLESVSNSFNAPNLEVLEISNLKISLDLSKCPLINLASWQGLVTNAANTNAITVTVHPTVYAKLTDESNAGWNAVLTAAEAKQITFATTN